MRWPKIEQIYGTELKKLPALDPKTEGGIKRWEELHRRVIEHVSGCLFHNHRPDY